MGNVNTPTFATFLWLQDKKYYTDYHTQYPTFHDLFHTGSHITFCSIHSPFRGQQQNATKSIAWSYTPSTVSYRMIQSRNRFQFGRIVSFSLCILNILIRKSEKRKNRGKKSFHSRRGIYTTKSVINVNVLSCVVLDCILFNITRIWL